jgi:hypothetical protein
MASNVIERRRVFVFGALEAKRRGRELPSSGRFERVIEGSGMTAVGDIGAVQDHRSELRARWERTFELRERCYSGAPRPLGISP